MSGDAVRAGAGPDVTMRIMHLATSVGRGGAQSMLHRLLEQQGGAGQTVVALLPGGLFREPILATGARLIELGPGPALPLRLARTLRRERPQLIQGWMYHGNLAASLGRRLAGWRCPLVWGIHHSLAGLAHEKPALRLVIRAGARVSRSATAIQYCSQASAAEHERLGYDPGRTVVIPNGFDCELFRPRPDARAALRRSLGVADGTVLVGLMARYTPMKGHAHLLAAARGLADVHLVMAGGGVDAANRELRQAIAAAGMEGRVALLGERADMPELMAGLDLLASPSLSEAFPMVLGEAMAAGVPCIATDVGDSALLVGDCGVVVPPGDPAALAAGLERLLALGPAGRARLGTAARARILERFAMAAIARRYQELHARLLAAQPQG